MLMALSNFATLGSSDFGSIYHEGTCDDIRYSISPRTTQSLDTLEKATPTLGRYRNAWTEWQESSQTYAPMLETTATGEPSETRCN